MFSRIFVSTILAASVAFAGSVGAALPAAADVPPDPMIWVDSITSTVPDSSTAVVEGPFDLTVKVTGGGDEDIRVSPSLPHWAWWWPEVEAKTIPGGTCILECQVTWTIDPSSQATPWYEGIHHIGLNALVGDRSVTAYGSGLDYRPRVQTTWVSGVTADVTVNTPGYAPGVLDSGGVVTFAGLNGRSPEEQVDVFVLPKGTEYADSQRLDFPRLASATGTWEVDPETGYATGSVHLDTASVPDGSYRLVAQARDNSGHYSFSTPLGLAVRHTPLLRLQPGGTGQAVAGRAIGLEVWVGVPRAGTRALGDVLITVGGVTTRQEVTPVSWYVPATGGPSRRIVDIPTTGLPLGRASVGVEVLDVSGERVAVGTTTIEIVDFHDTVTIPTLIVGKSAALHLKATAPAGITLLQCRLTLQWATGGVADSRGCPGPNVSAADGTLLLRPEVAGPATVIEEIVASDGVLAPLREFPVTVYANRTASLSAPALANYGTVQSASVTVKDEKRLGTLTPAAGVSVFIQQLKPGATRWVTIGAGTTGTNGVATLKYLTRSTGRLRAVATGAVPSTVVTTAERSFVSVASVTWSSMPTTARSGSTVTAAVYAQPYEQGASVRVQVRRPGAMSWVTLGSGTVGTNGYAKAPARFSSRGIWEVRVQRVATSSQAAGYSSIRRISIS